MYNIYRKKEKKRNTSECKSEEQKICFLASPTQTYEQRKKRNKAKHAHDVYVRRKIQAEKRTCDDAH